MEIKIFKLGNIDFTNDETIINSIHDEIKMLNAGGVQLILEWDDVFEVQPMPQKIRSLSVAIHAAAEYGYFNVFLMDSERNVYSLGFDIVVNRLGE